MDRTHSWRIALELDPGSMLEKLGVDLEPNPLLSRGLFPIPRDFLGAEAGSWGALGHEECRTMEKFGSWLALRMEGWSEKRNSIDFVQDCREACGAISVSQQLTYEGQETIQVGRIMRAVCSSELLKEALDALQLGYGVKRLRLIIYSQAVYFGEKSAQVLGILGMSYSDIDAGSHPRLSARELEMRQDFRETGLGHLVREMEANDKVLNANRRAARGTDYRLAKIVAFAIFAVLVVLARIT